MFEGMAQRSLDAMSRKDIAAVMRDWADDGVLEIPGTTPISGRFEGKAAIEAFFRRYFDRLRNVKFEVRRVGLANPIGFTFDNTIFIDYDVTETSKEGVTVHAHSLGVFVYRRGKVVHQWEWAWDPSVADAIWRTPSSAEVASA